MSLRQAGDSNRSHLRVHFDEVRTDVSKIYPAPGPSA
ncbi:hypothetical protein BRAS3843_120031 [Bradyrhizobium sp. STM 3843]|nr:hypothetical protein BRAS3843_120031 [Bradyrhizobium sp. STM 3843]